jgi:SAM-dependent methyltransferase
MNDVPISVDFKQVAVARQWAIESMAKRPYRKRFFTRIAELIKNLSPSEVLELGSGPGFLANEILNMNPGISYTGFDFSDAMHELSRENNSNFSNNTSFIVGDFMKPDWFKQLNQFECIVTMQAAHEVRHKSKSNEFLLPIKNVLAPGGSLIYCDHFFDSGLMNNDQLYMSLTEQESSFREVGFQNITKIMAEGSLVLWQLSGH